jgi:hypothetical protein
MDASFTGTSDQPQPRFVERELMLLLRVEISRAS